MNKSEKKFLKKNYSQKVASKKRVGKLKRGEISRVAKITKNEEKREANKPIQEPNYIEYYDTVSEHKKKKAPASSELETETAKKKSKIERGAIQKEVQSHQNELNEIKKTHPEFMKFLEDEGNQDLMDFPDMSDDEDDFPEDELEEAEDEQTTPAAKQAVTHKLLDGLQEKAEKGDLAAVRNLVSVFKAAVNIGSDDNTFKYTVSDGDIFTRIISYSMKTMGPLFRKQLKVKLTDPKPCESKAFGRLSSLIKSFLYYAIQFFDQATDEKMIDFFLQEFEDLIPFLAGFAKLAKRFLKVILKAWGSGEERTKLLSFFDLRELALRMPYPFIDTVLTGAYLTFVKHTKATTTDNASSQRLMMNCLVELFGIDFQICHKHSFIFIRQLAIHLRDAILHSEEQYRKIVTGWQFYHSLKFFSLLFATYPNQADIAKLIYPLIQIIFTLCRFLHNNAKFIPLRFKLLRLVHEIAQQNHIFVNTVALLLDILRSQKFDRKITKQSEVKFFEGLKVSKRNSDTLQFQEYVNQTFFESILEYFGIYATSISFPELVVPTLLFLKTIKKESKYPPFTQKLIILIEQLEANSKFIKTHRRGIPISPSDLKEANSFLSQKEQPPLKKFAGDFFSNQQKVQKQIQATTPKNTDLGESSQEESDDDYLEDDQSESKHSSKETKKGKKDSKQGKNKKEKGEKQDTPQKSAKSPASKKDKQPPKQEVQQSGQYEDLVQHFEFSSSDEE